MGRQTGFYYYRARYYDPKIGRFISEDPIGVRGGINFYSYVGNNPIGFADPMGLIKFNITYDTKYVPGFFGETNWTGPIGISPACTKDCDGWNLEFTVKATITMVIGTTLCPPSVSRHEQKHARNLAGGLPGILAPLSAAEGAYSSEAECQQAARTAMSQLRPPPFNPMTMFLHNFTYIPCTE